MAELSPAAQAVMTAAVTAYDDEHLYTLSMTKHAGAVAAAALRAVADQCQIEWNYHPDYPETEWVVVASDLLAIAAELEGQA